jgi:hypothetical protein
LDIYVKAWTGENETEILELFLLLVYTNRKLMDRKYSERKLRRQVSGCEV